MTSERGLALKLHQLQQNELESSAIEGDSPVCEGADAMKSSRAGHEKPCLNMGGPSSKAKYS